MSPARRGSKFRQLALTHAAMMGGEAAMVVALADSFFFDVDPNGARSRVLLFLLVSFAPFLFVAPFIGPVIDSIKGGRRFVVQAVAIGRIVLNVLMIRFADELALFPLVFAALVLQKTYAVSKSALVPTVVRTDTELVEANSKLGLIAGLTGFVAIIPAGLLQVTVGTGGTLAYGAVLFVVAFLGATGLPREVASTASRTMRRPALDLPPTLVSASTVMVVLRGAVGFLLFHLAFWLRTEDAGTLYFGLAVGMSSLGTMAGNAVGPRLRSRVQEEVMLRGALVLPAAVGLVAGMLGGVAAAVLLATSLNFSAAIGRLAFESIVQRDAPIESHGQAFARFETRFQFAWVLAATLPVLLEIPGALGFALVGLVTAAMLVDYTVRSRRAVRAFRTRRSAARGARRRAARPAGERSSPPPPPPPRGRRGAAPSNPPPPPRFGQR